MTIRIASALIVSAVSLYAAGPRQAQRAASMPALAFDVRRGIAVVAGGSRKTADGATWRVAGDTWTGGPGGWRQAGDLAPRDHHALVEDEHGGVLLFGGIGADRSAPWPDDTWRHEGEAWRRVATEGPAGRGRSALACDGRWRRAADGGPRGRYAHGMVFDDQYSTAASAAARTLGSGTAGTARRIE